MEGQFSNRWYEQLARELKSGSQAPNDADFTAAVPLAAPAMEFGDGFVDSFDDDLPAETTPAKKAKSKTKTKSKSKKKKKSDPVTNVILALSICIFLGSAGFLVYKYVAEPLILSHKMEQFQDAHKGHEVQQANNGVWEESTESTVVEEKRLENGMLEQMAALLEKNEDIVGWIQVPNTPIDYAVTQRKKDTL
ncbi:MAG: hypothetical protein IIU00_08630, partial [Clostridia bacterium]|nr:hypothetical protein [Clostridia bacterium]